METIFAQVSQQITTWDGAWTMAGVILCFFVVWLIGFYLQSGRLFRDIKRAVLRLRRVEKDQFVGRLKRSIKISLGTDRWLIYGRNSERR